MRNIATTFLALAFLLLEPVYAAQPDIAAIRSLLIKARTQASRKTNSHNWNDWSGYDKDSFREQTIAYELRNFSKASAPNVNLWVIWVAKDAKTKKREIYGMEDTKCDIPAGATIEGEFDSPVVKMNETRLYGSTSVRRDGSKPEGYILTLFYEGEEGDVYSSSNSLKQLASDEDELTKLIDAFLDSADARLSARWKRLHQGR